MSKPKSYCLAKEAGNITILDRIKLLFYPSRIVQDSIGNKFRVKIIGDKMYILKGL